MTNRYANGKIYSIRSYQTPDIYIGSTCLSLSKRLHAHRSIYKRFNAGKSNYMTSYEILKYTDHYIELIEEHKCENKAQLERREGQLIRETENCINSRIAGRTKKEYGSENKDKIAIIKKKYYENNKEVINEKYNCECKGKYTYSQKHIHLKSKKHIAYKATIDRYDNALGAGIQTPIMPVSIDV